jgi:UDP-N-acetyl-D-glucosamine dehydrogenase
MISVERAVEKFKNREAIVGVLGLGYAGLPVACTFAQAGFRTLGFDVDESKIGRLLQGESYIPHILSQPIKALVRAGTLSPTADFGNLRTCDAAIICVPTPLGEGRAPDLRYVVDTSKEVERHLHDGQLVVLESTTYPGTTQEVVQPILASRGFEPGQDYFLAFSPEREDPGNREFSTKEIPKLVGGVTQNCLSVAGAAYSAAFERVIAVSSARVAEAAKLLENVYRCVNIALVNELKLLFERMDIDIWDVIAAASTKPFGFTPFYPGPGLGGHCIPVDPFYLTWKARQYDCPTRFIELAGEINTTMPEHVVNRLAHGLNLEGKALKDSRILIIGVAYKRNTDDTRESPALAIIRLLDSQLAQVVYHDPQVPLLRSRHLHRVLASTELTPTTVDKADAVLIVTDHDQVDYKMIVERARLIIDTRNATKSFRKAGKMIIMA